MLIASSYGKVGAPDELVALAGDQMSRATVVGYGKTTDAQGAPCGNSALDQAADNLRLALRMGYNNLGLLRSDRRLRTLALTGRSQPNLKAWTIKERPPRDRSSPVKRHGAA